MDMVIGCRMHIDVDEAWPTRRMVEHEPGLLRRLP